MRPSEVETRAEHPPIRDSETRHRSAVLAEDRNIKRLADYQWRELRMTAAHGGYMDTIRRDVLNLITANEKIQSLLLRGEEFTKDEAAVVRMCATELLSRVPDRDAVDEPDGGVNAQSLAIRH